MTFYTALHAVDTLLEHDRVAGIVSHESRNTTLMKTNRYQAINRAYRPLYDLSRTVRYLANPATWVKQEDLQSRVFALLYDIEKSVIKLSNTAIELPALTLLS
ncbi:MAG: hypothetical protein HZA51_06630 [Planctomycetes bacterium]|nr:hypothetical protein [Planctomycetota bacterium]